VPALAVYLPSVGAITNGADQRASLRATGVRPGSGEIASVSVRSSAGTTPMAPDAAGNYAAVVTGLTNGVRYTFVARVCNTDGRCTESAPLGYTPYGTPQAGSTDLTVAGSEGTVSWTAAIGNAFPFEYDCLITVIGTPEDPSAPAGVPVGHGAGSRSFTARPDTTYQAVKSCGNGHATSVVRSGSVAVPAASIGGTAG
jgi:hypothetical protein